MEVSRNESASVNGKVCDIIDQEGRLIITPNPLDQDSQRNIPAELNPGESLASFLERHIPGALTHGWKVSLSGRDVPQEMWSKTYPKNGNLIAARIVPRKDVLRIVAVAALAYMTMGISGVAGGAFVATTYGATVALGTFMVGSLLINKVLAPKMPKMGVGTTAKESHSLTSQRNSPRPYEAIPTLWGVVRTLPDLAGREYTTYEAGEQYLNAIYLGGINVYSAADLSVGDTPASSYEEFQTFYNHFPGMPNQDIPLYSNADSIAGADLTNDGPYVMRTTSVDTVKIQVDIEGQLYDADNKNNILVNDVPLFIEIRETGTTAWVRVLDELLTNSTTDMVRRTFEFSVAQGQYDVQVKLGKPRYNEGDGKDACKFTWTVLKSIQPDDSDYSAFGRFGVRVKATGQLSGTLDTLQATYTAKPMPIWNGSEWVTATTRENGLSNPGAIILQALRGVYDSKGNLQFGLGRADSEIGIEGLKAFMLHCAANGYTYDKWITDQVSMQDFFDEVALAGMGQFSWVDGTYPTVVFAADGQPRSAVLGLANMQDASFSVAYTLANGADGIEYQYLDRNDKWQSNTIRVLAPGKTVALNPARVTGEGVTTAEHAARMARYHLAQSIYQYKTIEFSQDLERLDYRRLGVLSVSHDLTQWGYSGRIISASKSGNAVYLELDDPVPSLQTPYIGLRLPGERDYRVFQVQAFSGETTNLVLNLPNGWPAGVAFPGDTLDNPAYDTIWCYDFKATPGYRVRVTGIEPADSSEMLQARVTCVPEGPEFWNYVINGTYEPAPNSSIIPQLGRPKVSNIKVIENVNVQGDTEWYELSLTWDAEGAYAYSQVWAGVDGSELQLVNGRAEGTSAKFRISRAGSWLIDLRPFNERGQAGEGDVVLYITTMTQIPPRVVDNFVVQDVPGGLRRFAWNYTGDTPPAFAGVQIRYIAGEQEVSIADWERMTPLGEPDDVYRAQFETTKPEAGLWTFACRSIDTAGQLSQGMKLVYKFLQESFEQVQQPDLTPPPRPTGLVATPSLTSVYLATDPPTYTEGHGHGMTRFYFTDIVNGIVLPETTRVVAETSGHITTASVELGAQYAARATWVSVDGMESEFSDAVFFTVGKIGDDDLSDDLDLAEHLADGSISGSKLADESIDATKFAQGIEPVTIVDAPELPTTKSTTNISWNGSLYTWDDAEGKYKTADLGDISFEDINGQLDPNQLADKSVSIAKFADGIEPVTLVTSLPTARVTATVMYNSELYRWNGTQYVKSVQTVDLTGQVQSGQLADNAVIAEKIATGAVGLTKFASGLEPVTVVSSLPTTKGTANVMFNNELYTWDGAKYSKAVKAVDITGQLTDAQLAAISAAKLTGQITETQISDSAISTPKLAAGAVIADKIAAGAIITDKLAANAVTAGKIAANAVTANTIEANAVTSDKISANAVTAGKIAAGVVTATEIAAKAITVEKLAIAHTDNLIANSTFEGAVLFNSAVPPTGWSRITNSGGNNVIVTSLVQSGWVNPPVDNALFLQRVNSGSQELSIVSHSINFDASLAERTKNGILMQPGDEILLEWLNWQGTVGAGTWDAVGILEGSGNLIVAAFVFSPLQYCAGNGSSYIWADHTGWSSPKASLKYNGTEPVRLYLRANNRGQNAGDSVIMANMYARRKSAAQLIVDGAIIAGKIAVDAVTANNIAAGSVTAVKLAANSVTADKIEANAITSDKLAVNSVTAGKIAAGVVGANEIAAKAITVEKLAVTTTDNLILNNSFETSNLYAINELPTGWSRMRIPTSGDRIFIIPLDGGEGYPLGRGMQLERVNNGTGELSITPHRVNFDSTTIPLASRVSEGIEAKPGDEFIIEYSAWQNVQGATGWDIVGIKPFDGSIQQSGFTFEALQNSLVDSGMLVTLPDYAVVKVRGIIRYTGANPVRMYMRLWMRSSTAGSSANVSAVYIRRRNSGEFIVDGAITAGKIAAGSITTDKLAANAVTAGKIAAGTITANELAANAVTADKLSANSVTTAKIAAGAVNADQIAAKAITVEKLSVMYSDNLITNSTFQNETSQLNQVGYVPTGWSRYINYGVPTNRVFIHGPIMTGVPTSFGIRLDRLAANNQELSISPHTTNFNDGVGVTGGANSSGGISCQPGDEFLLEWWAFQSKENACTWDAVGVATNDGVITTANLVFTSVLNAAVSGNTAITTQVGTMAKYQASLKYSGANPIRLYLRLNLNSSEAGAELSVYAPYFRRRNAASLIVDGAITANKIAANAIAVGTAAIQNGAIVNVMIANAAVDDAKISNLSAAKLTVGDGTIGGNLKSSNYAAGSAGWILQPNGLAEFSGVTVRGNIFATAGTIGSFTINTALYTGVYGPNYTWPTVAGSGVHIGPNGILMGNPNYGNRGFVQLRSDGYFEIPGMISTAGATTFSGALNAASGTFAGSLSAASGTFSGTLQGANGSFSGQLYSATGTFSGSLTASAVNAVDTINIAGQAVTVPVSVNGASASITMSVAGYVSVLYVCPANVTAQTHQLIVRRNGSIIMSLPAGPGTTANNGIAAFVDGPLSGTITYSFEPTWTNGAGGFIQLLGTKR